MIFFRHFSSNKLPQGRDITSKYHPNNMNEEAFEI
jgi:hypothetical protein